VLIVPLCCCRVWFCDVSGVKLGCSQTQGCHADRWLLHLQLTWLLGDEGIPADYRHMNGEIWLRPLDQPLLARPLTVGLIPAHNWLTLWLADLVMTAVAGFGVHTFKLITQDGKETYIKWHWISKQGEDTSCCCIISQMATWVWAAGRMFSGPLAEV
jgi:Catalase